MEPAILEPGCTAALLAPLLRVPAVLLPLEVVVGRFRALAAAEDLPIADWVEAGFDAPAFGLAAALFPDLPAVTLPVAGEFVCARIKLAAKTFAASNRLNLATIASSLGG